MERSRNVGTPGFWTGVLNLEGFEVIDQRHEAGENVWHFTLLPTAAVGVCPQCGRTSTERHQTRDRERIHDLPMGDSRVQLTVRRFQFLCAACERCFTPTCAVLAEGTHATERFLERCVQLIRTGDVRNAAAFFGVPERTLERWYYDYLERRQQSTRTAAQPIRSIGIDELSLKKGGGGSSP